MCLLRFARQRRTCPHLCGAEAIHQCHSDGQSLMVVVDGGGKFSVITSVIIITIVSQFRSQPSFTHVMYSLSLSQAFYFFIF